MLYFKDDFEINEHFNTKTYVKRYLSFHEKKLKTCPYRPVIDLLCPVIDLQTRARPHRHHTLELINCTTCMLINVNKADT